MIYKTYIEKFNTIISGSKLNTGINPISEIVYGKDFIVSRAMIWFDHNKVKELMCNGTMVDREKMTHRLKMTNAGSVDFTQLQVLNIQIPWFCVCVCHCRAHNTQCHEHHHIKLFHKCKFFHKHLFLCVNN